MTNKLYEDSGNGETTIITKSAIITGIKKKKSSPEGGLRYLREREIERAEDFLDSDSVSSTSAVP